MFVLLYEDVEKLYAEVHTDTNARRQGLVGLWHLLQVLERTCVPSAWHSRHSQTILADFRNRNDAKVAVVYTVFEQGAIQILRYKGESLPEGHKVKLPPPRKSKKARWKATNGMENEDEPP